MMAARNADRTSVDYSHDEHRLPAALGELRCTLAEVLFRQSSTTPAELKTSTMGGAESRLISAATARELDNTKNPSSSPLVYGCLQERRPRSDASVPKGSFA